MQVNETKKILKNAFEKIVILMNKYVSHGFDKTLPVIWIVYQKHHITVWVTILWTPTIPNPILESQDMQSCSLFLMMLILAFAPFLGFSTEPLITLNPVADWFMAIKLKVWTLGIFILRQIDKSWRRVCSSMLTALSFDEIRFSHLQAGVFLCFSKVRSHSETFAAA